MITLYSTNCPKCKVIETKLKNANIEYSINLDIETMKQKGMKSAPYLELEDGSLLDFSKARLWLQNL